MTSTNWQQSVSTLDTELKRVAIEWLRQAAGNSATSNVQLNDAFRQTFLQVSNDSLNAAYSIVKGESQFNQLYPSAVVSTASDASGAALNQYFGQRLVITAATGRVAHRTIFDRQRQGQAYIRMQKELLARRVMSRQTTPQNVLVVQNVPSPATQNPSNSS